MAAKFRKIDPRIWTDEGFVSLDSDGKLLALWMLSCSRVNRCGVLLWSAALASEETKIDRNRIDTVYDTVCQTLGWIQDVVSKTVFFPRWWRYNRPDNASALKGAMSDLRDVPRNGLKQHFLRAISHIPSTLHVAYKKHLDTVYDTVSSQEKEKEQETEQEQKRESAALSPEEEERIKAPIKNHEAGYMPILFRAELESLVRLHPKPTKLKQVEIVWRQVVTTPETASEIGTAHSRWCAESSAWADGIIHNLENWISEGLYTQQPDKKKNGTPAAPTESLDARIARKAAERAAKEAT